MKRANCRAFAVVVSIAVSGFAAGLAHAQRETAAGAARLEPAQQRDERRFLKDAAAGSRFEGEASRLALGKSNNPGVRSLATALTNHHAQTSGELLYLLHVRGMAEPMLGNDQRKTLNLLAKLQGVKFDREYMDALGLKGQQSNVHLFEKASLATRDPHLKAWIERKLPTLRYHLAMAERLVAPDAKLARTPIGASPVSLGLPVPAARKPSASSTR